MVFAYFHFVKSKHAIVRNALVPECKSIKVQKNRSAMDQAKKSRSAKVPIAKVQECGREELVGTEYESYRPSFFFTLSFASMKSLCST